MKKRETIEINEKQFTISELTVRQIIEIAQNSQTETGLALLTTGENVSLNTIFTIFLEELKAIINLCCDFTIEDLEDLAPSEIKLLFAAFKEVNADFLLAMGEVGIITALNNIKNQMVVNFSKVLAD